MAEKSRKRFPEIDRYAIVRYRTLVLLGLLGVVIVVAVLIVLRPPWLVRAWESVLGGDDTPVSAQSGAQAKFINLDGSVKVKKRDSAHWIDADLRTPLEAGDSVQTGPTGIARITFVDGTTYVVKPDTLIVVEANDAFHNRSTRVGVQVSTGAVDLTTGSWEVSTSTSEVRFENAVARMQQNTHAAVRQNPESNIHEITVNEGGANVRKGKESIEIGPYERASFRQPGESLRTEKVLARPSSSAPATSSPSSAPTQLAKSSASSGPPCRAPAATACAFPLRPCSPTPWWTAPSPIPASAPAASSPPITTGRSAPWMSATRNPPRASPTASRFRPSRPPSSCCSRLRASCNMAA
jgi:hypothetical protein